jgi:hypothetical protein
LTELRAVLRQVIEKLKIKIVYSSTDYVSRNSVAIEVLDCSNEFSKKNANLVESVFGLFEGKSPFLVKLVNCFEKVRL